jgi:hypothetical protein
MEMVRNLSNLYIYQNSSRYCIHGHYVYSYIYCRRLKSPLLYLQRRTPNCAVNIPFDPGEHAGKTIQDQMASETK